MLSKIYPVTNGTIGNPKTLQLAYALIDGVEVYSAELSDLGSFRMTDSLILAKGDTLISFLHTGEDQGSDGDILTVNYAASDGTRLVFFND